MRTLLLAFALFAGQFGSLAAVPVPVPYRAFCRTLWLFPTPCAQISAKLVQQIKAFNPVTGCNECHYMLVSAAPLSVIANHTSADGLQAEVVTFTLSSTMMAGGCRVSAQSVSLGFTSLLDDGLNYCNLYNLLSASGLNSTPGFMEMTTEQACLGYGPAMCSS